MRRQGTKIKTMGQNKKRKAEKNEIVVKENKE